MSILVVFKICYYFLEIIGGSTLAKQVTFESLESKTEKGKTVYNKIMLEVSKTEDIWKMKQSHSGIHASEWDSIKIIVHKKEKPFQVSFHQLKNGKEIEYKTSCFRCHSNGPRLIRPNYESVIAPLGKQSKLTILKWNLLIKSYGNLKFKKNNSIPREITFIKDEYLAKSILKAKSCTKCHYKNGQRSILSKENVLTMKFLIKKKEMPPWPYTITKSDINEINAFIYGF